MSLEDFNNSPICKNKGQCSDCIHNNQFRSNVCRNFSMKRDFVCPYGNTKENVKQEPITNDYPILNEEKDRQETCLSCPLYKNGRCGQNGQTTPWKSSGCPSGKWIVNTQLPSIKERVGNFFTFLANLDITDKIIAPDDVAEYRLDICSHCPLVRKKTETNWKCGSCGCSLNEKVKSAQSECPKGYWTKYK